MCRHFGSVTNIIARPRAGLVLGLSLILFPLSAYTALRAFSLDQEKPAGNLATSAANQSLIHLIHLHLESGAMQCTDCHIRVKDNPVMLYRPGDTIDETRHQACIKCHEDKYKAEPVPLAFCRTCHTASSDDSVGAGDVKPFPLYENDLVVLNEFSHKHHVDRKGRIEDSTGFRKDCTFCHSKFDQQGKGTIPKHSQCSTCHSRPNVSPHLAADSTSQDCRGCHNPEEIENPRTRSQRIARAAKGGVRRRPDLPFSHQQHFRDNANLGIQCTTCHYEILESSNVAELTLPKMWDCAACHDNSRRTGAAHSMKNCSTCHKGATGGLAPSDHFVTVKPADHTEFFRTRHAEAASAQHARCVFCHMSVSGISTAATGSGNNSCAECHSVSRPRSHNLRWKDEAHGRIAGLNRESCATCHASDFCSRCHNLAPRSHQPLAFFSAGGGHAQLARLNERNCYTCHTFQNSCGVCHNPTLRKP